MAFDMSTLMPGMNPSGTNQAVPTTGGNPMAAVGTAGGNPFLPSFAPGTSLPGQSNPMYNGSTSGPGNLMFGGPPSAPGGTGMSPGVGGGAVAAQPGGNDLNSIIAQIMAGGFPANGVGPGAMGAPGSQGGGFNLASSLGFGTGGGNTSASGSWAPNQNDLVKALHKAGFSAGDAALLYNFLQSGAGFNQGAINNLLSATFAAQQPQIQRGEADIAERFGSMGLGMSSPAAIGLGDYLSQVSLGQGQLAAQAEFGEYNQAVQNYLSVLMGGKGQPPQNMFQNILQWVSTMSNATTQAMTKT